MSSSPLVIHLFGPMRVLVHSQPLPRVRTRSVEWLLALLVLRHGRVVDRSWLSGTLWLDSEQSQALRNLREDLARLRKALGSESARLQSPSRDTLTFDLTDVEVNMVAFDAAIRAGDETSLRSAIALYIGPLLEGCHEEWVTPARESREQACLNALETLAALAEKRGDFSEAISLLRRAEIMDGLRDSIQRDLMRVLTRSGDAPTALMTYREHRLRLRREMHVEPDAETTHLFQQIRQQKSGREEGGQRRREEERNKGTTSSSPHPFLPSALPHPITTLIGREEAIGELVQQVAVSRLITLVGTGGVGKTRLAIQIAHETQGDFPDGAVFVALASLSEPALLPAFLATALGMREEGSADEDSLWQSLISWLCANRVLLVLDNCEHLIEATAQLCQTVLEHCPDLHILATSRQRLGLTGEVVWRVPSLPAPDPERLPADEVRLLEAVMQSPAVQLFVERARMVSSGYRLAGGEDARVLARLCWRLDGIPLAIELAAARAGVLTLPQIDSRLDDRFRLLTGGSRGVLTRHQTLRALIDWSYDLLSEAEQVLLRRLSVFVGGWVLEAAESVCCAESIQVFRYSGVQENAASQLLDAGGVRPIGSQAKSQSEAPHPPENLNTRILEHPDEVLDLLASLVEKSLVLAEAEPAGGLRYQMLETIREYALERLRNSGEEAEAWNQHLSYCLHLAQEAGSLLRGSDLEAALERVEVEIGNFRAGLQWAQTDTAPPEAFVQLMAQLWPYWEVRGYHTEGREHLRAALNRPGGQTDTPEWAQALLGVASLAFVQVELKMALEFGKESLTLFRRQNDPRSLAEALILCGHASLESDAVSEAAFLLEEALEYCKRSDWARGSALALTHLGLVAIRRQKVAQARTLLEEGLSVAKSAGHAPTLALCLHNLGCLASGAGDYATAVALLEKSLEIWRRLGHRHKASLTLRELGHMVRRQGNLKAALYYFEEAVAACREQGNRYHMASVLLDVGSVHYEQVDYESARRAYAESLELFTQIGNDWGINGARMNLGSVLFHLGEPKEAQALHRDALAVFRRTQSVEGIAWSLERLAVVEALYGEAHKAARQLGVAAAARERLERRRDRWDQEDWDRAVAAVRVTLGESAFESACAEGQAMTTEQAIAYALTRT